MGLSGLADEYGFISVAPDGTPSAAENNPRFWNASAACCNWEGKELDDSAYIMGIIDAVKAKYSIDERRVYITGPLERGLHGAPAGPRPLGRHRRHRQPGRGRPVGRAAVPPHAVHVLQIHGDADTAIAYEGGEIQGASYPSARASAENWAGRNGCDMKGADTGTLDLVSTLPGADTTVSRYTDGCKPAARPSCGRSRAGPTCPSCRRTSRG